MDDVLQSPENNNIIATLDKITFKNSSKSYTDMWTSDTEQSKQTTLKYKHFYNDNHKVHHINTNINVLMEYKWLRKRYSHLLNIGIAFLNCILVFCEK